MYDDLDQTFDSFPLPSTLWGQPVVPNCRLRGNSDDCALVHRVSNRRDSLFRTLAFDHSTPMVGGGQRREQRCNRLGGFVLAIANGVASQGEPADQSQIGRPV